MTDAVQMRNQYKHMGDLSAVDPPYRRWMCCDDCMLSWYGCWDNFECPKCGKGELPSPTPTGRSVGRSVG